MKICSKILQKPTQGQKYVQKQNIHEASNKNVDNKLQLAGNGKENMNGIHIKCEICRNLCMEYGMRNNVDDDDM